MNIHVVSARAPEWGNHEKTIISMLAVMSHLPDEVPFAASLSDALEHGRDAFERALAGEFGEIAPYAGPSVEELESDAFQRLKAAAMSQLESMIAPLERARRLGVATPEELAELERLERYSVYLLRAEGPDLIALSDMKSL